MYNWEVTLIQPGEVITDEIGNQRAAETKQTILCKRQSVKRSEFYDAKQFDLKPEIILTVHAYEYSGEPLVEFKGKRYSVIKTFEVGTEEVELTCGTKKGVGQND